jgi:hypothetical protein
LQSHRRYLLEYTYIAYIAYASDFVITRQQTIFTEMSRSPPRYSLDEGERLATGTAENHPLLSTEHESGKVDARDDKSQPLEQISRGFGILDTEMGMRYGYGFGVGSGAGPSSGAAGGSGDASTAEGAGAAAPAPRALYGKLTTLYSLHPTYMVPGGTETCIGILGRDRQVRISSLFASLHI